MTGTEEATEAGTGMTIAAGVPIGTGATIATETMVATVFVATGTGMERVTVVRGAKVLVALIGTTTIAHRAPVSKQDEQPVSPDPQFRVVGLQS